ncbi:TetR family transcriptional regulator [Mycobacterium arosiense ATCC BAA-1401 = DSM 45069]|uniref:TetR family transcriptional regulator n=1 Tax=Mycobacterium arosiense ATCC BAA-1401 = DSM 45069 TaxID=1265311 RepID=A0A1W9ZAJ4_MYCAI|nr:TetR family transcriptional regulator [Mycobacterium arosiense ATCC BAA-1401 = DSM 45069]
MPLKDATTTTVVKKDAATSKDRRPRRPSLSNEEFLDKALDLFLERGFERTSIDAITAAAGIAKRTVYARYGDKKTLFKAALQRAIEEWIVPVERLRQAECATLEESLLAIAYILVENMLSPKGLRLLRLTNAESGHMPEIGVFTVRQGEDPTITYLADLFRRHLSNDATGFPEARDAAQAFLDLVVGGPANEAAWGVVSEQTAINQRTRYGVRLLLHGLLGSSTTSAAVSDARLADENLRLKKLLAESLIELDQARERLGSVAGGGKTAKK